MLGLEYQKKASVVRGPAANPIALPLLWGDFDHIARVMEEGPASGALDKAFQEEDSPPPQGRRVLLRRLVEPQIQATLH